MRLKARRDNNHGMIIAAARAIGLGVLDTAPLGNGLPDVVLCYGVWCWVCEIKNEHNQYKNWTDDELDWHIQHRGETYEICTDKDVMALVKNEKKSISKSDLAAERMRRNARK